MARITAKDNQMSIMAIEKRLKKIEYLIFSFWIPIIAVILEKVLPL